MEDASERLRRLLSVIPLFADHDDVSFEEIAKRVGVDAMTVLGDLHAITGPVYDTAGYVEPVGVEFGHESVSVRSQHFLRPMRITVPELCALELGLAMVAAATPPDERGSVTRARERVRKAIVSMPAHDSTDAWDAPSPPLGDNQIVSRAREAALGDRKLRIRYRAANDATGTERTIHPYKIIPTHGTWYVAGHCERSEGLRFFRADRIESALVLDETFDRSESPDVAALLADGKPFFSTAAQKLVVRYSPKIARWIAEREGKALAADGSVTIEHPLADERWAVRHVLQYGPDAEVLGPESVRSAVRETLERILAADA